MPKEDERLYGKDAVCPKEWQEWLRRSPLPDFLKPDGPEDILDLLPEPVSSRPIVLLDQSTYSCLCYRNA